MATPLTSAAEARGIFLASLRELFLKFDSFVEMLLAQGCLGSKGWPFGSRGFFPCQGWPPFSGVAPCCRILFS
jgi:hypothetical protein